MPDTTITKEAGGKRSAPPVSRLFQFRASAAGSLKSPKAGGAGPGVKHYPAGSSKGGQFMPSTGGAAGGGAKAPHVVASKGADHQRAAIGAVAPKKVADKVRELAAQGHLRASIVKELGLPHPVVRGALLGAKGEAAIAQGAKIREKKGLPPAGGPGGAVAKAGAPAAKSLISTGVRSKILQMNKADQIKALRQIADKQIAAMNAPHGSVVAKSGQGNPNLADLKKKRINETGTDTRNERQNRIARRDPLVRPGHTQADQARVRSVNPSSMGLQSHVPKTRAAIKELDAERARFEAKVAAAKAANPGGGFNFKGIPNPPPNTARRAEMASAAAAQARHERAKEDRFLNASTGEQAHQRAVQEALRRGEPIPLRGNKKLDSSIEHGQAASAVRRIAPMLPRVNPPRPQWVVDQAKRLDAEKKARKVAPALKHPSATGSGMAAVKAKVAEAMKSPAQDLAKLPKAEQVRALAAQGHLRGSIVKQLGLPHPAVRGALLGAKGEAAIAAGASARARAGKAPAKGVGGGVASKVNGADAAAEVRAQMAARKAKAAPLAPQGTGPGAARSAVKAAPAAAASPLRTPVHDAKQAFLKANPHIRPDALEVHLAAANGALRRGMGGQAGLARRLGIPAKRVKEVINAGRPRELDWKAIGDIGRGPVHRAELIGRVGDHVRAAKARGLPVNTSAIAKGLRQPNERVAAAKVAAVAKEAAAKASVARQIAAIDEKNKNKGNFDIAPGNAATVNELGSGAIRGAKPLGEGGHINAAYHGMLGSKHVVIKPSAEAYGGSRPRRVRRDIAPGKDAERERAGYLVAKHLGLEVPIAEIRHDPVKGKLGIQAFHENGGELGKSHTILGFDGAVKKGGSLKRSVEDIAFLDGVIGNTDRHSGNALISKDGKSILAIDHGLAFPESKHGNDGNYQAMNAMRGAALRPDHMAALHSMQNRRAAITKEMEAHIGTRATSLMWERIDKMQQTGKHLSYRDFEGRL